MREGMTSESTKIKKDIIIHMPVTEFQMGLIVWLSIILILLTFGIKFAVNGDYTNWFLLGGIILAIIGMMILHDTYGFFKLTIHRKVRFKWKQLQK